MTISSEWPNYRRTLAHAYAPRPPIQYIWDGVIPRQSVCMIYGSSGSLKSIFLNDLACSVAAGRGSFLEKYPGESKDLKPFHVMQTPVLWLDFDNGGNLTDNRFEAFGKTYKLADSTQLSYYCLPSPPLDAGNRKQIEDLELFIKMENSGLVILDNLATISGGRDENSSEILIVFQNLRWLAEQTGAAIIVIHHDRKSSGHNGREGENMRGFSGIRGALDTALFVEREPDTDEITITSTKKRAAGIEPFGAIFTYTHKPGTNDLETAKFWRVAVGNAKITTSDIQDKVKEILNKLLPGGSYNQSQLIQEVKKDSQFKDVGEKKIRAAIISLESMGIIPTTKGPKNATLYGKI